MLVIGEEPKAPPGFSVMKKGPSAYEEDPAFIKNKEQMEEVIDDERVCVVPDAGLETTPSILSPHCPYNGWRS